MLCNNCGKEVIQTNSKKWIHRRLIHAYHCPRPEPAPHKKENGNVRTE